MRHFIIIVAATASTLGIGRNGKLPWRLAGDMAHFKNLTISSTPSLPTTSTAAKTTSPPNGEEVENEVITKENSVKISATSTASTSSLSSSLLSTRMNAVIMGRKTWESIPSKFRPLSNRLNIILSRNPNLRKELNIPSCVCISSSLPEALKELSQGLYAECIHEVYVIGGASIYEEAINSKFCKQIELTSVYGPNEEPTKEEMELASSFSSMDKENQGNKKETEIEYHYRANPSAGFATSANGNNENDNNNINNNNNNNNIKDGIIECDTFFPSIPKTFQRISRSSTQQEGNLKYLFQTFAKDEEKEVVLKEEEDYINMEELQYLNLVDRIIREGSVRMDRTKVGTKAIFGTQMRFNLANDVFPLLTTKRVFWRGVVEELLWFVQGSTNAKLLQEKNIHIWDGNSSREFLDSRGFTDREEGDLGPVYGFQWRHFGADYTNMHANYEGQGIDQLIQCIEKIKTNPTDRRIILTAWNPKDLDKMALPPCHMFVQFFVADNKLSCQMYQRSADCGLGVPFNIASYSLLTRMMAQVCGLEAGEFIHTIGDSHVYLNHIDALKIQLQRKPRRFPILKLNPKVMDIDKFTLEDFTLDGYKPYPAVKMDMAV